VQEAPCANGSIIIFSRVQTQWTANEGGDGGWYSGQVVAIERSIAREEFFAEIMYDDGDTWSGTTNDIYALPEFNAMASQSANLPGGLLPDSIVAAAECLCGPELRRMMTMLVLWFSVCSVVEVGLLFFESLVPPSKIPRSGELDVWYEVQLCPVADKTMTGQLAFGQPGSHFGIRSDDGMLPSPSTSLCTETCGFGYSRDGACDDGAIGSSYSVCREGTDCQDCGPREHNLPGVACPAVPGAPSATGIAIDLGPLDGFQLGAAYAPAFLLEQGTAALITLSVVDAKGTVLLPPLTLPIGPPETVGAAPYPPTPSSPPPPSPRPPPHGSAGGTPTGRRLLKGGTYSSYSGSSNGGRTTTFGNGRWGHAAGSRATHVPIYPAGGGGGGRTAYYYGPAAIPRGASFTVVRRPSIYSHCFTCGMQVLTTARLPPFPQVRPSIYSHCFTCTNMILGSNHYGYHDEYGRSCDGSRVDCGEATGFTADSTLDRYELAAATFVAPDDPAAWPISLRVQQLDVRLLQPVAGISAAEAAALQQLTARLGSVGMQADALLAERGYTCSNTCKGHSTDGWCDDGGLGSEYSLCDLGTDCTDCGVRGGGGGIGAGGTGHSALLSFSTDANADQALARYRLVSGGYNLLYWGVLPLPFWLLVAFTLACCGVRVCASLWARPPLAHLFRSVAKPPASMI